MRRSPHNLSHHHLATTDMGYLIPVATLEVLPGDTFRHQTVALARIAPLVNPVMHPVDVRVHHWYVPNRILWPEWDEWIVGKDESTPMPTVTPSTDEETWLLDHMGVAADHMSPRPFSALPVRAYNQIWNEFYRDQDLSAPRDQDDLTLARIAWEKDYLTTARPKPQQGDPVSIGFSGGEAPVNVFTAQNAAQTSDPNKINHEGNPVPWEHAGVPAYIDNLKDGAAYADLTQMTGGIDVNDLRRSIALQRFAEARSRFGSRYADYLRFLGVNPSDGRLDRPEYLGGGRQTVSFSEVLATAEGANTAVGDMFGHGIAAMRTRPYRKMFEEHGWVLTLMSVRPKTMYMDIVPRQFTRFDPMQYWQKELEILPWQEVYQSEVHKDGDETQIFGYVQRYDEYRHQMSYVSGMFRTGPEVDWHMARTFATPPVLNESFITCTPTDRVYADKNMPELLINARHEISARRLVRRHASLDLL